MKRGMGLSSFDEDDESVNYRWNSVSIFGYWKRTGYSRPHRYNFFFGVSVDLDPIRVVEEAVDIISSYVERSTRYSGYDWKFVVTHYHFNRHYPPEDEHPYLHLR